MENKTFKELLSKKGLTITSLAVLLGVNKSTVSRWAVGRISAENAVAVEEATGIPRAELRPDIFEVSA